MAPKKTQAMQHSLSQRTQKPGFFKRMLGNGLFNEYQLSGPAPDRLICTLTDYFTANQDCAQSFYHRHFTEIDRTARIYVQSERLNTTPPHDGLTHIFHDYVACLMTPDDKNQLIGSKATARYLLDFDFFRDFIHLDIPKDGKSQITRAASMPGVVLCRMLIDGWLSQYSRFNKQIWTIEASEKRLYQLLLFGPILLHRAPTVWRSKILHFMARLARHLDKASTTKLAPADRLSYSMTMILAGMMLPHHEAMKDVGQNMLRHELQLQFYDDGGYISRNPVDQLHWATRLQQLVSVYHLRQKPCPNFLKHHMQKASHMVSFFRCGDGGLSVFNGGHEGDQKAIAKVLSFEDGFGQNHDFAHASGFHLLSAIRNAVHIDTGRAENTKHHLTHTQKYDSAFSFQFTVSRQRIITNCGMQMHARDDDFWHLDAANAMRQNEHSHAHWAKALSLGAAHSTIDLIDNDHDLDDSKAHEYRKSISERSIITATRQENEQGQLIDLERDYIFNDPHAKHRRRLFLNIDGTDLRGEDQIFTARLDKLPDYMMRFHLYPDVNAAIADDQQSILIQLPNSESWRFSATQSTIALEQSIYAGQGAHKRPCAQIVLRLPSDDARPIGQTTVKWRLHKEEPGF